MEFPRVPYTIIFTLTKRNSCLTAVTVTPNMHNVTTCMGWLPPGQDTTAGTYGGLRAMVHHVGAASGPGESVAIKSADVWEPGGPAGTLCEASLPLTSDSHCL